MPYLTLILMLTLSYGATAQQNPFTKKNINAALGRSKKLTWFAYGAKVPTSWVKDPMAQMDDPGYLKRLMVRNSAVPTMRMLGKQQYFTYKISLALLLKKPSSPKSALDKWMKSVLKNRLLASSYHKWPVTWQQNKVQAFKLSGGRTLYIRLMTGGSRPWQYVQPLAVQLVGALLVHKNHAALLGTGLTSDNTFNMLNQRSKQLAMQGFALVLKQLMAVAATGKIKLPSRDRSFERRLRRKRRFLHAARSSSTIGSFSKSSISSYRALDIKFKGSKLTMRNDFSNIYSHTRRSIFDAPGTDPKITSGSSNNKKYTPLTPYEVRRRGSKRWLMIYLKGTTPTFYSIETRKTRRCSKKRVSGMAINGLVEGIFSTTGVWCVYTKPSRAKF